MPKEVFRKSSMFDVELRWGRLEAVQIATVMKDPQSSDSPTNLRDLVATWEDGTADVATGLYVDLDRDTINALIRSLRRARDAVFGKDE